MQAARLTALAFPTSMSWFLLAHRLIKHVEVTAGNTQDHERKQETNAAIDTPAGHARQNSQLSPCLLLVELSLKTHDLGDFSALLCIVNDVEKIRGKKLALPQGYGQILATLQRLLDDIGVLGEGGVAGRPH